MTELKIKQADINNNGNQRLMGEIRGRGEPQNMYHVWLWVSAGGWGGRRGVHLVFCFFFPFWKYVKYKTWCNSNGFVCVSLTNISHEQHWQISLCSFSNRMKTFTNHSHLKSFACVCSPNRTLWQKFYSRMGLLYSRLMLIISNNCNVTKEIR